MATNPATTAPGPLAGRVATGLLVDSASEEDTEDLDRLLAALRGPRADRLASDAGSGGPRRCRGHDLAAVGLRLESLGDVHGVADHRVLESPAAADRTGDHGSGVQSDPDAEGRDRIGAPA